MQTKTTQENSEACAGLAAATGSPFDVKQLRAKNAELHRRCQQAESAVAAVKKEWDKRGGPKGGSFGRALLACECVRLTEFVIRLGNALREQNERWGLYGNESQEALKAFEKEMENAEVSDRRPAASDSRETHNGGSLH